MNWKSDYDYGKDFIAIHAVNSIVIHGTWYDYWTLTVILSWVLLNVYNPKLKVTESNSISQLDLLHTPTSVENSLGTSQKLKMIASLWFYNSTPALVASVINKKDICVCVHCTIIYNGQDLEADQVSTMKYIYAHIIECYLSRRKEENLQFAVIWMGLHYYVKWIRKKKG